MTTTSHDAGAVRIALPEVAQLVAGRWSVPTGLLDLVLEDPFLGTALGAAVATSADDCERVAAAAATAYESGAWVRMSPGARADVLDAVASELDGELPRLAALESFATGVPVSQTSIVGVIVPGAFRLAAQMLRGGALLEELEGPAGNPVEVHRLPLGPALCLVPWNAPAPMAAHKIASSLAAGCPTILKPSEYAPYATTELARVVSRVLHEAGLDSGPDVGTFQVVQGGPAVGGTLVRDPRVRAVSFTGGLEGGRAIATACAPDFTATQLELGGNNALVVLPDADPADAARAAVDLLTTLNGQWCRALGRLVVPAELADAIVELALDRLATMRAGDPLDETTELGPIVHSVHLARLRAAIEEKVALGGTVASCTPLPEAGHFLAPTLITAVASTDALHEVFGPVASVHTYRDLDEALELANATPYGLEGYVLGADTERAMAFARGVRAGEVKVNGSTIMSLHLMTPRPAWGLSGLGEEGTLETIRVFTGARVVGVESGFALHSR